MIYATDGCRWAHDLARCVMLHKVAPKEQVAKDITPLVASWDGSVLVLTALPSSMGSAGAVADWVINGCIYRQGWLQTGPQVCVRLEIV